MSFRTKFIVSVARLCAPYLTSRILSSNIKKFEHQSPHRSFGDRHVSYRRNLSVHGSVQPGAPLPPQPPSYSWRWILGIALSVVLPFVGNKWGPLLQFKTEVDNTVEMIEEIVEVVEKVAEVVDKVAEGIDDHLPEGGKLKKVVDVVEDVAEATAKDAHAVGDAIDKFQEVEVKVENIVETLSEHQREEKNEK